MTSSAPVDDTSTSPGPTEVKPIQECEDVWKEVSEPVQDDSYLGKAVSISAGRADDVKVVYDIRREAKRIQNRIVNLGLPPASTTTEA